jgi:Uma2 family endonuclease
MSLIFTSQLIPLFFIMGDAQKKNHYYTIEEYEALVRNAKEGERFEYANGQIIVMDEYTTKSHNRVVGNMYRLLINHYEPKGCSVYTENVRLKIENENTYRLPDVMVTCSERDALSEDIAQEPVLLVEVLSTNAFTDLVEKVHLYKKIAALQAYIIINPAIVWVRVYQRGENGNWLGEKDYTSLLIVLFFISWTYSPPWRVYIKVCYNYG